jgi:tetratricopeptide (TPR) repeat protein
MFRSLSLSFLIIVLAIFPVIAGPKVECFIIKAPEKPLQGVKKIAILNFEGSENSGNAIADYITGQLMKEDRGIYDVGGGLFSSAQRGKTYLKGARTNIYEIVERGQLNKIIAEQKLSNSGIIDDQQAAQIGKVLGIDAIVTGVVSYTSSDKNITKKYTNVKTGDYYVNCVVRNVSAKGRMKLISVNTAQIIGTKDTVIEMTQESCEGQQTTLRMPSEIADACFKDIALIFVDYFTPRFVHASYGFADIKNKQFKDKSKEAAEYLKKGELDNAFIIYKAIYDADSYNAEAADAVAGLYDIVGNYPKALDFWKIAAELDAKKYSKSVSWVETEINTAALLSAAGINIEPYEFSLSQNALAEQITTKGKKEDRLDVFSEPKTGTAVVAKIPGDTKFTVLEKSGDWFQLKLLGGKKGYLNRAYVK